MRRVIFVLVAVAVLWTATPAWAQVGAGSGGGGGGGFGDPNRCTTAADGDSGLSSGAGSGAGMGGGGGGSWGPNGSTPTTTPQIDDPAGMCGQLLDAMVGGENPGPHPTGNYDLGNSNGTWCVKRVGECGERQVNGTLMRWGWGVNIGIVRAALGLARAVGDFFLVDTLEPVATSIADNYDSRVVQPMGLPALMLALTGLYAVWLVGTGRRAQGWVEIGQSLVMGALTVTVLAAPGTYLGRAMHFTRELTSAVSAAAVGAEPGDDRVTAGQVAALHKVGVEDPHLLLNWGPSFPSSPACADVAEQAIASGPWGTSSQPRDHMKEAGCKAEAAFNRDPSWDRIFGAWMTAGINVVVMAFVFVVGMAELGCQVGLLGAIMASPFAFAFAHGPGRWRSVFWWWAGFAASSLAGTLVMGVLRSWVFSAISATLGAASGLPMLLRLVLAGLLATFGLLKVRHFFHGTRSAVANFAKRTAGYRASNGGNWEGVGIGAAAGGAMGTAIAARRVYDNHQRRAYQRESRDHYRAQRERRSERQDGETTRTQGPAPRQGPVVIPSYVAGRGASTTDLDRILSPGGP